MRNDLERVWHMLEAIERIERYATRGEAVFFADELIQNWMVQNIQILVKPLGQFPKDLETVTRTCPGGRSSACGT